MNSELINYDAARSALQRAASVDEVKKINDKAAALALYAKQSKNVEMEAQCIEIRRRAERRIGEMMEEMRREDKLDKGGAKKGVGRRGNAGFQKTHINLASQGIDKNLADRARKMARMSSSDFERGCRKIKDTLATKKIEKEFKSTTVSRKDADGKRKPDINTVLMKEESHYEKELEGNHMKCLQAIVKHKDHLDPANAHEFLITFEKYLAKLDEIAKVLRSEFGAIVDMKRSK